MLETMSRSPIRLYPNNGETNSKFPSQAKGPQGQQGRLQVDDTYRSDANLWESQQNQKHLVHAHSMLFLLQAPCSLSPPSIFCLSFSFYFFIFFLFHLQNFISTTELEEGKGIAFPAVMWREEKLRWNKRDGGDYKKSLHFILLLQFFIFSFSSISIFNSTFYQQYNNFNKGLKSFIHKYIQIMHTCIFLHILFFKVLGYD